MTQADIPHRIRVGDKLYSVEIVEAMKRKHEMGRTYYGLQRIEIGRTSNLNGRSYTKEELDDTFWHELTHAILHEMGYRLCNDEKFVSVFAAYLAKAIKSVEFK